MLKYIKRENLNNYGLYYKTENSSNASKTPPGLLDCNEMFQVLKNKYNGSNTIRVNIQMERLTALYDDIQFL